MRFEINNEIRLFVLIKYALKNYFLCLPSDSGFHFIIKSTIISDDHYFG